MNRPPIAKLLRAIGLSLLSLALVACPQQQPSPTPDFTLALNPTSLTVTQGQAGNTTLTLTPRNGFTGQVNLSLVGAPQGVTLEPASVNVTGANPVTQTLTLRVGTEVLEGSYALTVKGRAQGLERTAALTLTVRAPGGGGDGGKGNYAVPRPETRVLGEETTRYLLSVSQDGSVLTFSQTTTTLQGLAPGNVIVLGVTPQTPQGLLRKVVSVEERGGNVVVTTAPASWVEAVRSSRVNVTIPLRPADVVEVQSLVPGLSPQALRPQGEGDWFVLRLPGLRVDKLEVDVELRFTAGMVFEMQTEDFEVQKASLETYFSVEDSLRLSFKRDLLSGEVSLAKYTFSPYVIPVGSIPVVVVPELTIVLGWEGNVTISGSLRVSKTVGARYGLVYQEGQARPISEISPNFTVSPPEVQELTGGVELKAYVGPSSVLKLYGVAGPYANLYPGMKAEVKIGQDPWWKISATLESEAGIKVEVLNQKLAEVYLKLIDEEWLLLRSGTFTLSIPGSASLTVPPGGSTQFSVVIRPEYGFTGQVDLSLVGAPQGVTLEPASVNVTGANPVTQTLTLRVPDGTPAGTYNLKLRAVSGILAKEADLILKIDGNSANNFPVQFGTALDDGVWDIVYSGNYLYAVASVNGDRPGADPSSSAYGEWLKLSLDGSVLKKVSFAQGKRARALGIGVDSQGNVYVSAEGEGPRGSRDVFLYKFSSDGSLLWEKVLGTENNDGGTLTIGPDGYLYVTGSTMGSFPGHTNQGYYDAYIAKIDLDGRLIWLKQMGTSGWDSFSRPTFDEEGNLYLTGIVSGPFMGNPYSGAFHDIPVVKIASATGQVLWAKQFSAGAPRGIWQGGYRIAAKNGKLYIVGGTRGSLPGYRNPGCGADAFIVVYDYNGNRLGEYQFGTEGDDVATSVDVDDSGRIFVGGWAGAFCVGAFPGQRPHGDRDGFIAQIDFEGRRLVWVEQFGGPREDWGVWDLQVDGRGGVYFAGFINAALPQRQHLGGQDAFVSYRRP